MCRNTPDVQLYNPFGIYAMEKRAMQHGIRYAGKSNS